MFERIQLCLDAWLWGLYHRIAWRESKWWGEGGVDFQTAFDIVTLKLVDGLSKYWKNYVLARGEFRSDLDE
jgi:hypothetical protein